MKMSDQDKLKIYENSIGTLKGMIKVQCSDGNWNYDSYMHGMANGMIFCLSLFTNERPEYLSAPEKWLKDEYFTDEVQSENNQNNQV